VPVLAPVFLQISVKQCNLLHLINCKLNWYKGIQIGVNIWKPPFETHNQGVHGSSPCGPTLIIRHLRSKICKCFFYVPVWCQDLTENW